MGARFLFVEVPLLLQGSIALLTGMVAATFVPPVRRSIPRVAEVGMWIALLTACLVGVMSITDPGARELSATAAWGAEQVVSTMASLLLVGVVAWITDHRFVIASWMVIIAGADILALMFIGSLREARPWQPRVRLREWMELPMPALATAAAQASADPLTHLNRRIAAGATALGATSMVGMREASNRIRREVLPREARRLADAAHAGRAGSRTGLESLHEAATHLGFAARAWYEAAGQPAVRGVAARLRPAALRPPEVIDIEALLSAQSIGWYGPLTSGPPASPGERGDASESRSDRLAS